MAEIISGIMRSKTFAKPVLNIFIYNQLNRIASIFIKCFYIAKQLRLDKTLYLKIDKKAQLLGILIINN